MSLVKTVKNPISLARIVMERTSHNYIVGEAAEKLAVREKLERMDASYFSTDKRLEQLMKAREGNTIVNDHDLEANKVNNKPIIPLTNLNSQNLGLGLGLGLTDNYSAPGSRGNRSLTEDVRGEDSDTDKEYNGSDSESVSESESENVSEEGSEEDSEREDIIDVKDSRVALLTDQDLADSLFPGGTGTVGCVCMYGGHVAAATSTGGLTNKMAGRIGELRIPSIEEFSGVRWGSTLLNMDGGGTHTHIHI